MSFISTFHILSYTLWLSTVTFVKCSKQFNQNMFIKYDTYAHGGDLLSEEYSMNILECANLCVNIKKCSMMAIYPGISGDHANQVKCLSYQVTTSKINSNVSNAIEFEVWYKMELYLEIFERGLLTTVFTTDVTCPTKFVIIGSGCYYVDKSNAVPWEDAVHECSGVNSVLADFNDAVVSIYKSCIENCHLENH